MSEEPPFVYQYGLSFFCAILSFLMQEFNGICNVYWYVGHYSKYRFEQQNQLMKHIEINSIRRSSANKIKIVHSNENLSSNLVPKPSTVDPPKIGFDIGFFNINENNIESLNKNEELLDIDTIKNFSTSNMSNFDTINNNKDLKKQLQDVSTSVSDINKKSMLFNTNISLCGHKKQNKNFNKITQPTSSINDSPSIKFIIDERLTAPLSLNILPASYSNKLKPTLLNPKNVILNEEDFNTPTSMSFTSSQSPTPQMCSATSTSQEEGEESTPNLTLTSSSNSSDSTLSPVDETSMTESACQMTMTTTDDNTNKINPEIMLLNKMVSPSSDNYIKIDRFKTNQNQNMKQSNSFNRKKPIDLENDQDDLKAKFYKLPIKTNNDSAINNCSLLKENNQNRINNIKFIKTINPNHSKSFDDHFNDFCLNNNTINTKKQHSNNLIKNISCTFSNDLITYLCDKSLSENNNRDTLKAALKKHEQNQIYQNYLFEKYLKKQKKKDNELEYLKNLLIKNATDTHKFSSHISPISPPPPPPPTSTSNSTLHNSPSNFILQKNFSKDLNVNQNQINIPVLVKRQQSHHYLNPNKLNMNDGMVHSISNSLRVNTNVNSIHNNNTANQHQSRLFDNENNDYNNMEACFNNNLYLLSRNSSTQNSPRLIGYNPFNNTTVREKSVIIGSEEMAKYRNESNVSRLLRHKNKYRPKFQRNKSSDYQPVTRYIIDDFNNSSKENYNNKYICGDDDDNAVDSRSAFNPSTIKRLLNGEEDNINMNKEINNQNNRFMTINSTRSGYCISNETNAQRLRRNFKRTTSV
jgi:hypothetical protein